MIIALGFKVDNERAIQFRKWANGIYDVFMQFVSSKIKEKIKHAFKSYD